MSIERRSGAPSTRSWLLGLALGTTCAAAVACSATSGSTQDQGWPQTSGGGPLAGSSGSGSGSGSGGTASSGSGSGSGGTASSGGGSGSSSGNSSGGSSGSSSGSPTSVDASTPTGGDGGASHDAAGDAPAPVDAAPQPFTFTLIDTTITGIVDGSPVAGLDPLAEGATINLTTAGTALSIRANVPATGSVGFALDATYTHTENATPYMLCGDNGAGTITSCANVLTVGKHTLTATPYSAANLGGTAGPPATVDFVIVDAVDAGGQ